MTLHFILETYEGMRYKEDVTVFIITCILAFIPYENYDDSFLVFEEHSTYVPFYDKYFSFGNNYEISNPVTKNKGINEYIDKLIEKELITEKEKNDFILGKMKNISNVLELYYSKIGRFNQFKSKMNSSDIERLRTDLN